ncbi:MAG: complex I NDUFA9 subunit family protein [Hyphomicrobiaceae bacterium]|nr:complex I NDUFA9 subunit family protein [Hyphomicrobiaceae bacterium]
MAAQTTTQVTIIGGSGFVGRYVVRLLAQKGWRIKIACRNPELAGFLQPLGGVGQISSVRANIRDAPSIRAAIKGADAIVNLAGILSPNGAQSFDEVHVEGARRVTEAAKTYEICNFVHVSALGANPASKSRYARSKAMAEAKTIEICPKAVILRPSLIFGEEDEFFNRFASMARTSPMLPAIGSGRSKFQPVYVGDVARAIVAALEGRAVSGATYELGGPDIYRLKELLHMTQKYSGRKPRTFPIPFGLAMLNGAILQMLPGKILTMDQVRLLRDDSVVSQKAQRANLTLEALGITPTNIDAVVPVYLEKYRRKGMYEHYQG